MSYIRVIPRDLFNEGNLLKCYGRLYLNLEKVNVPGAHLEYEYGDSFEVVQDENDGSITLLYVKLVVRGQYYPLRRPLNSREAWPLYVIVDDTEIAVFDEHGAFTPEMLAFISG